MPVPVFDPQGKVRLIPDDQVNAALGAGGQRAIKMVDPQGKQRWIPEDQQQAALQAGGKLAQPEQKGFLRSLADSSGLSLIGDALAHPGETLDAINDLPNPNGKIATAVKSELRRSGQQLREAWNTPSNEPVKAIDRTLYAIPGIGGALKEADEQAAAGNYAGAAGTAAGTIGSLLAPEAVKGAGKVADAAGTVAARTSENVRTAPKRLLAGDALDEVIPNDTVTPRQAYETAKAQGVNLDVAQATQSTAAKQLKKSTEHRLTGSPEYEALQAENREALNNHVVKLLDEAAPSMSRADFGNMAKADLLKVQQDLNEDAGGIFDHLTKKAGNAQPSLTDVRTQARQIVAANKGYFDKHPDMLSGQTARAWKVVNNLAEQAGPKVRAKLPPDTWSDLHMLRSDLMDMYRSPDIVGSRAEGWLKQLAGAVDKSMTGAQSGLTPQQLQMFRQANDLYSQMKETFDNPQNILYHVVRSTDGLQAANHLANIKPSVATFIRENAPQLTRQLQRQAMERIFSPAGNAVPEWSTLSSRFNRAQKEQLAAVLDPEQIKNVQDAARTARLINIDSNPSGTAKAQIPLKDLGSVAGGASTVGAGIATGNPALVAGGAAAMLEPVVIRKAARYATNPEAVANVMAVKKGPAGWQAAGAKRLAEAGVDQTAIDQLAKTPKGRSVLIHASSVSPKSRAMQAILIQISANQNRKKR